MDKVFIRFDFKKERYQRKSYFKHKSDLNEI